MKTVLLFIMLVLVTVTTAFSDDSIKGPYQIEGAKCYLLKSVQSTGSKEKGIFCVQAASGMFQYRYELSSGRLYLYDHGSRVIGRYILKGTTWARY